MHTKKKSSKELIDLQKSLYARFQDSIGPLTPALRQYSKPYAQEFSRIQGTLLWQSWMKQIEAARTVLCGDYHTLPHSQRTALRLVQGLAEKRRIIIALECLCSKHTPWAESYIKGGIIEENFLYKIQYTKTWGFAWENYAPFFELARKRSLKVVGINAEFKNCSLKERLKLRDAHAAQIITDLNQTYPDALVFVLCGDLHLAKAHLPTQIRKRSPEISMAVVHQNSEEVFWKMGAMAPDTVVDLGEQRYCLTSVAPWIKLQSYLEWSEDGEESWDPALEELQPEVLNFLGISQLCRSGKFLNLWKDALNFLGEMILVSGFPIQEKKLSHRTVQLGHALYQAYLSGKVRRTELRWLFQKKLTCEAEAKLQYQLWSQRLRTIKSISNR